MFTSEVSEAGHHRTSATYGAARNGSDGQMRTRPTVATLTSGASQKGAGTSACCRDPAIDGLRALSIMAVFLFHFDADWIPGGFLGVDVFYVISGYVVASSQLRRTEGGRTDFLMVEFWMRRINRLWPALLAMVLVTTYAVQLMQYDTMAEKHRHTAGWALVGASNMYLAHSAGNYFQDGSDISNPFIHTWSLGIEEQFYVIFGCLGAQMYGRENKIRGWHLSAFAGAISFACAVTMVACYEPSSAFYLPFGRMWQLFLGVNTCFLQSERKHRQATTETIRLRFSKLYLPAIVCAFFLGSEIRSFSGAVVVSCVTALGLSEDASAFAILRHGALPYLGEMSYALYLWHWPVRVVANTVLGPASPTAVFEFYVLSTLILAFVTRHTLETPFIRRGGYRSASLLGLAAFAAASFYLIGNAPTNVLFLARGNASTAGAQSTRRRGKMQSWQLHAGDACSMSLNHIVNEPTWAIATAQCHMPSDVNACLQPPAAKEIQDQQPVIYAIGTCRASQVALALSAIPHISQIYDVRYYGDLYDVVAPRLRAASLHIRSVDRVIIAVQSEQVSILQELFDVVRGKTDAGATIFLLEDYFELQRNGRECLPNIFRSNAELCETAQETHASELAPQKTAGAAIQEQESQREAGQRVNVKYIDGLSAFLCGETTCGAFAPERQESLENLMFSDRKHLTQVGTVYIAPFLCHAMELGGG